MGPRYANSPRTSRDTRNADHEDQRSTIKNTLQHQMDSTKNVRSNFEAAVQTFTRNLARMMGIRKPHVKFLEPSVNQGDSKPRDKDKDKKGDGKGKGGGGGGKGSGFAGGAGTTTVEDDEDFDDDENVVRGEWLREAHRDEDVERRGDVADRDRRGGARFRAGCVIN